MILASVNEINTSWGNPRLRTNWLFSLLRTESTDCMIRCWVCVKLLDHTSSKTMSQITLQRIKKIIVPSTNHRTKQGPFWEIFTLFQWLPIPTRTAKIVTIQHTIESGYKVITACNIAVQPCTVKLTNRKRIIIQYDRSFTALLTKAATSLISLNKLPTPARLYARITEQLIYTYSEYYLHSLKGLTLLCHSGV